MKKIISMAVMLYITMTAMAQKGELAMNENIRGKENVSRNVAENTVGNTAHTCCHSERSDCYPLRGYAGRTCCGDHLYTSQRQ